jgi:hypothetical protein
MLECVRVPSLPESQASTTKAEVCDSGWSYPVVVPKPEAVPFEYRFAVIE